ncbi:class I adenylate-forming enzyme family protein [Nocardioides endophyticus]|uniref:Class I adenylate-forming enzyme family protein n=1 Tax=Nocardioides endophyticus TaxID=1353775 RepID=A0ABP8Z171_9ACTN
MTTDDDRLAALTRADGPFPLVERTIGGVQLQVFDREPRTLRDAFLATADLGDRDAVVYRDERWTYDEQWSTVVALAHALRDDLGVAQGDRVAIAMRNYPEWIFTFWALQLLGAVVVPLNAWLRAGELGELLADARPSVVVADAERLALLRELDTAALGVRHLVAVRCPDVPDAVVPYEALLARLGDDLAPPECEISPDDPATILFTSGTTGRPKGALGTHRNHSASLLNKIIRSVPVPERFDPDGPPLRPAPSARLVTFPFFHIAGINNLYTLAYSGHRMVLMHKWDAQEAARLVEAEGITDLAGPPFVIQTFLDAVEAGTRDVSSLKRLGMGGSSAPLHLIARVHATFEGRVAPSTGYGLTETTSGVVAIGGQEWIARPDSVGRPLPTVEVRILDEAGRALPVGEVGEIAIRGPQVITHYEHGESPDSFVDGWFRTGDQGRLDEEGYLSLSGRLKDVVIRGGENINAAEVEDCLSSHPAVLEVAVFGLPHESLGEELAAVVRLGAGTTIGPEDLQAYVAERLAAFKVPARIAVVGQSLPRTASGKIVKRDIVDVMDLRGALAAPAPATR